MIAVKTTDDPCTRDRLGRCLDRRQSTRKHAGIIDRCITERNFKVSTQNVAAVANASGLHTTRRRRYQSRSCVSCKRCQDLRSPAMKVWTGPRSPPASATVPIALLRDTAETNETREGRQVERRGGEPFWTSQKRRRAKNSLLKLLSGTSFRAFFPTSDSEVRKGKIHGGCSL